MISHKYNCIFIHIPKNGGSSIERLLWPSPSDRTEQNLWMGFVKPNYNKYQSGGLQHLLSEQVLAEVGLDIFEQYYKFSIVRNPWDKAVSQFLFTKQKKFLQSLLKMKNKDDFKVYLNKIQRVKHVQWEHQHKFVYSSNGDMLVDKVGKFENFENEVKDILGQLRFSEVSGGTAIPHEKKSERSHYADYYDEESKQLVAEIYAKDIELFNYTFEKGK